MSTKKHARRWTAAALVAGGGFLTAFVVFAHGWPLEPTGFSGAIGRGFGPPAGSGDQQQMLMLAAASLVLVGAVGVALVVVNALRSREDHSADGRDEVSGSGQASCRSPGSPPR